MYDALKKQINILLSKPTKLQFKISIILVLFVCFQVNAQTLSGSLNLYLNNWLTSLPGNSGNNYSMPTNAELTTWNQAVDAILNQDITSARSFANGLNYSIIEYTDTADIQGQLYYILEEKTPKIHNWGIYVFNSSPCRNNLVLQAPHPKYDYNTGKEAIYCYTKLNAKSLFIAGTHRCNHSLFSPCDGQTSACSSGTYSSFRVSDMAHNVNSVFQNTTEQVYVSNTNTIFVQFHGFTKRSTDPYVIISNGTRETPSNDVALSLKNELALTDAVLTFKIAHVDLSWNRLIAFTNTQGRYLNNSSNPCHLHNNHSNGNFIHIEQEKNRLRLNNSGWNKMYTALTNTFQCTAGISEMQQFKAVEIFPNPALAKVTIKAPNTIMHIQLIDFSGKVLFNTYPNSVKSVLELKKYKPGIYYILIKSQKTIDYKKLIIK